ncbi:MAG: hypothetical protein KC505_06650 [Myxococcales bacterium]|nr:hypothetical protein [Myxococcales bacterium]
MCSPGLGDTGDGGGGTLGLGGTGDGGGGTLGLGDTGDGGSLGLAKLSLHENNAVISNTKKTLNNFLIIINPKQ